MGHQVLVPITAGKLDLGPWEQVFYAEFDGQRKKRVVVKVMGSMTGWTRDCGTGTRDLAEVGGRGFAECSAINGFD